MKHYAVFKAFNLEELYNSINISAAEGYRLIDTPIHTTYTSSGTSKMWVAHMERNETTYTCPVEDARSSNPIRASERYVTKGLGIHI